ncbi:MULTISPECIES: PilW family protein [Alkalimonas]|uniref:PilW family protein n=1 Tax=Alkalimonas mucilaginosa TaxID=3057676 RepID=A0ABU7JG29_9GAMM|nr:PilW family protein [Alkalimonas sp. MEB004]MEE2024649.1 PilW family protein [Alkalimonas sp. MEB004]
MTRFSHQERGLSLVELMIAAALALSVLLVLLATTSKQSQMSRETMQLAMLQQQGQLTLNLLQTELQQLGFWAGFTLADIRQLSAPFGVVSGECRHLADDSGSFPQAGLLLVPLYAEYGRGESISCLGRAASNSSVLQFKRLLAQPLSFEQLKNNRYYLQVLASELKLVDSDSATTDPAAEFWPYLHQLFYVQWQDDIPVLMRKRLIRSAAGMPRIHTDSVIDGVEVLYFEFGIDSTLDGRANYFVPLSHMQAEHWYQQEQRIVAISYYVVVRSLEADVRYLNEHWYPMGQSGFQAPGDHYRRLQLQSTQYLHNVALQYQGG